MPIYKVRIPITATCSIYVTAKNKDEARELRDICWMGKTGFWGS